MPKQVPICESLHSEIRELFDYNSESGVVTWKFCGVGRRANNQAGHKQSNGYIEIAVQVQGKSLRLKAHRLAWFLTYGAWPTGVVDHINGDRSDNRLSNLRDVTHKENLHNIGTLSKSADTGIVGVRPSGCGRFKAAIEVSGKEVYLGTFITKAEARASYVTAKKLLHAGYLGR